MGGLELQYRRLQRSAEPFIRGDSVRIPGSRFDVEDEPVETLPDVLVADVERVHLAPEGAKQFVQVLGVGHGSPLVRATLAPRRRGPSTAEGEAGSAHPRVP